MKKIIVMLFCCLLLMPMLFAAGAREGAKQELIINSYMSDEAPKKVFADLVAEFERQNPTIAVTVNTTAHEQFKTLLPSWLTSRQAPDVVTWFAGYRMQSFAERGLLEPINNVFPGGSFEAEFPASFRGASSYNGDIYFMPQSWYWWAVYYNTEVFNRLNLKVPTTWTEFLNVCEVLKRNGVSPIAMGAKETWTVGGWFDYMNSAVNGGEFHQQLTMGNVPYTDPRVRKTFEYLIDLSQKGYFQPNATSYAWQEAATLLFKGEAGMYLMGQFVFDVAPAELKGNLDFFRFPTVSGTSYSVDTPTDGFMIPKNAKNKDAAKLFLAYLATAEAQEMFAKPLGRLAANTKVAPVNPEAAKGLAMVMGAEFAMQFYDRDAPEEMAAKGMNAIIDAIQNPARLDNILADLDKERVRIYGK
jgi:multiple sugar transport system substrate-binding protein